MLLLLQLQPLQAASSGLGIDTILRMCLFFSIWITALSDSQIYTRNNQQERGYLSGYCQILHDGYGTGAACFVTAGLADAIVEWNVKACLTVAEIQYLVPALLSTVVKTLQHSLPIKTFRRLHSTSLIRQNLSPLTFNVLNQTRTLSVVLCYSEYS